jgi:hypothetical protein
MIIPSPFRLLGSSVHRRMALDIARMITMTAKHSSLDDHAERDLGGSCLGNASSEES